MTANPINLIDSPAMLDKPITVLECTLLGQHSLKARDAYFEARRIFTVNPTSENKAAMREAELTMNEYAKMARRLWREYWAQPKQTILPRESRGPDWDEIIAQDADEADQREMYTTLAHGG